MQKLEYKDLLKMYDVLFDGHHPEDPHEKRRMSIVQAATKLFTEHGYRKTSIERIVKEAGVAKGSFYLEFSNKQDLLYYAIAVEEYFLVKNQKELFESITKANHTAVERLQIWISSYLVSGNQMTMTASLLSGNHELLDALAEMDPAQTQLYEEVFLDHLTGMISEAIEPHHLTKLEVRDRAKVFMGIVYSGISVDPRLQGGMGSERFCELLGSMLVRGIAVADLEATS